MLAESVVIPLLITLILTQFIGVYGVFVDLTVSGVISIIIAIFLWRRCIKNDIFLNSK